MFAGANPTLFYTSLSLLFGGVAVIIVAKVVGLLVIQRRVANLMTDPQSTPMPGRVRHPPRGLFDEFSTMHQGITQRQTAMQTVMKTSVGLIAALGILAVVCYLAIGGGVVGLIVYLVQRYGVA